MTRKLLFISLILISHSVIGQTGTENLSVKRKAYNESAYKALRDGNYKEAVFYYRKVTETDTDTLLDAAEAYGIISSLCGFGLHDTSCVRISKGMQLYLINKSLEKYPDNSRAYIDRLSVYKYSEDKKGEAEFIKLTDEKFGNKWEVNFALAYHFITMDFLWPDQKDFAVCAGYLKKAVELNPSDFNSLLLLSVAYPEESAEYFKKLYQLAPEQFVKNESSDKGKIPYRIRSVKSLPLGKDLSVGLDRKACKMLKLIK